MRRFLVIACITMLLAGLPACRTQVVRPFGQFSAIQTTEQLHDRAAAVLEAERHPDTLVFHLPADVLSELDTAALSAAVEDEHGIDLTFIEWDPSRADDPPLGRVVGINSYAWFRLVDLMGEERLLELASSVMVGPEAGD